MTEQTHDQQADGSNYVHLMVLAFLGRTGAHLRIDHRVAPTDDRRENAAAHMQAHGVPLDARWSYRLRRFVVPTR